jgi:hypothetical protein
MAPSLPPGILIPAGQVDENLNDNIVIEICILIFAGQVDENLNDNIVIENKRMRSIYWKPLLAVMRRKKPNRRRIKRTSHQEISNQKYPTWCTS